MPDPASAVVVPLGSAKLPGDDGASWLVDAERGLWIGDDGGGQTVIWSLSTRAPMERLSLEAALDKDSAVTVHPAGAQLVVMAGDALQTMVCGP